MFPRLQQAWKENKWAVVLNGALCVITFVLVYWWLIPAIESQNRVTMLLASLVQIFIYSIFNTVFSVATEKWMKGFTFMLSGFLLIAFALGSLMQTLIAVAGGVLFFRGVEICNLGGIYPFSIIVKARKAWAEWASSPDTQKVTDGSGKNGTEKCEERRSDNI